MTAGEPATEPALAPAAEPALAIVRPRRETVASWPLADRAAYLLCWAVGIGLCAVTLGIVLLMLVKGISQLRLQLLLEPPSASLHQSQSGGFSTPIVGTLIVTAIGTAIAVPAAVALATWLSEYSRPRWLARAVESAIETIAGIPSIVLALFGLLVFARPFFGFLSGSANNGSVSGQSFLVAGIVMGLLAIPLITGSVVEGFMQVPPRLREASFALGKTRATTTRRVLLPTVRPAIASGAVLGMGRIIGDTAIIWILLGGTLRNVPVGSTPILGTLRGTGSTLTSYIYSNAVGEGNSPQKAYAAAFVLLAIVLALNALVTRLSGGRKYASAAR
ncbi:MAG TPA: ABC transporter permease subunit [Solirubrobacteraceae bacterium]|jgi:phosphate transport system permease protein|nr:ABC transporter permease subunit [Solirubrobacteraceae bacterium]